MTVEVKENAFGKIVPKFLLNFMEDSSLQQYYRDLLKKNYEKGFNKIDVGQCAMCHSAQTVNDHPRLKPLPKMTKKIHKMLVKRSSGKQLGKYEQHILKKFLQSKQQMIVKCPSCQVINRMGIMSKEDLIQLRAQHMMKISMKEKNEASKAMKRKKKKKKKQTFIKDSLMPQEYHDESMEKNLPDPHFIKHSGKKTISLPNLIKGPDRPNQSFLWQKSKGVQTPPCPKRSDTPLQSKQDEKKKIASRQKKLKAYLKDNLPNTGEKSASLSDFLSSL